MSARASCCAISSKVRSTSIGVDSNRILYARTSNVQCMIIITALSTLWNFRAQIFSTHSKTHTHTHTNTYTYTLTHTNTHTDIYTHTYSLTLTHIQTHSHYNTYLHILFGNKKGRLCIETLQKLQRNYKQSVHVPRTINQPEKGFFEAEIRVSLMPNDINQLKILLTFLCKTYHVVSILFLMSKPLNLNTHICAHTHIHSQAHSNTYTYIHKETNTPL